MFPLSPRCWLVLATGALSALPTTSALASESPCPSDAPCATQICETPSEPSWIFRRSTYTNDPYTGARVAQYMRIPPVEPLADERAVTSRYRRSRTNLRGANGSVDTYYEVQSWGNGRGGIDAEWERFHDAWKDSYLQGGYYNQGPGFYAPRGFDRRRHGRDFDYGYGYPGNGYPGYGGPWHGGDRPYDDPYYDGPPHGGGHYGGGHHHGGGQKDGRRKIRHHHGYDDID